jgi:hypothetical protein
MHTEIAIMKYTTIVRVIAAALLAAGLVPASSAQDHEVPEGIEVISITAKRPAPALATACMNEMMAHASGTTLHQQGGFNEKVPETDAADSIDMRRAFKHCMTQANTGDGA